MPITKPLLAGVAASIAACLAGCGTTSTAHVAAGPASGTATTAGPAPVTSTTQAPTTTSAAPSSTTTTAPASQLPPGWKPVTYGTVKFAVPAAWPVYDLRADPNLCIRFDVHAVYLGHVGPHPECPATVVGKTDSVHVEPFDSQARAQVVLGPTPTTVAGQPALTDPNSDTTRSIVVALERSAVLVTLSYSSDPTLDRQILATFQAGGGT